MIIYLEFQRTFEGDEPTANLDLKPVRFKVKDEDEALTLYEQKKLEYPPDQYKAFIHYCYHDEDPGKRCKLKPIEEFLKS